MECRGCSLKSEVLCRAWGSRLCSVVRMGPVESVRAVTYRRMWSVDGAVVSAGITNVCSVVVSMAGSCVECSV